METKEKKMTFKSIDFKTKGYTLCNPETIERSGDYDLKEYIVDKWETFKGEISGNGNVNAQAFFNINKGIVEFYDYDERPFDYDDENYVSMYKLISAPLALYRLICIFNAPPATYDGYKAVWHYSLKHKETGKEFFFSEWKGAFGFWVSDYTYKDLDEDFLGDIKELIEFLVSDQIPHPYDGCTAGQVA